MRESDPKQELQTHWLDTNGPVCLIVAAQLAPIADLDRFQPAGFPEIGHVIYDAPRDDGRMEKVCLVDSPASMANHLETVCLGGTTDVGLHQQLVGLPYVVCVTDRGDADNGKDRVVVSSLTEGHRLASDYFLDGRPITDGQPAKETLRDALRREFKIIEVKKDKTYFIPPETWWSIYKTIFRYDPNSLVHGVMFAKEQIKISRALTAHLEAFGAGRVGRSGVKFDRLGKTTSGQPIFAVDEETAREIRATFIVDLALLRSYGRNEHGLNNAQKRMLLDLAIWKIAQLVGRPFRYRSGCQLTCKSLTLSTESQSGFATQIPSVDIEASIRACEFPGDPVTRVYYPASDLFKPSKDEEAEAEVEEERGKEESED